MRSSPNYHHPYTFVFVVILFPALAVSYKTLLATESLTISSDETIVSHNETFELGFFTPGTSSRWYLGIWYKKIPTRTYVWVANRDNPLSHPNGSLKISSDNNLVIYDHSSNTPVWSTNLTVGTSRSPLLLDNGNFVLRHSNNNEYLWQSFDFPTDTLLQDMKLGWDNKTGLDRVLRSWKALEDPSSGDFSTRLETRGFPEYYVFNKERIVYRSGPWIGNRFSCIPEMKPVDYMVYTFTASNEEVTYSYQMTKPDVYSTLSVSYTGTIQRRNWIESAQTWKQLWYQPKDICDNYKQCGSYGYGDSNTIPSCNCIKGFERRNEQEWALRDDSAGCVRKTRLSCDGRDGFVAVKRMKLPDTAATVLDRGIGLKECEAKSLQDCNCTAYANTDIRDGGSGCVIWKGGLFDIRSYANGGQDLYVKLAAADLDVKITSHGRIIGSSIGVTVLLLLSIILFSYWKRKQKRSITIQTPIVDQVRTQDLLIDEVVLTSERYISRENKTDDLELPLMEFEALAMATNRFSVANMLGQGGFGIVYKGMLPDGKEIAVKRLSKMSLQGTDEFKNEVRLIARLQHINLVRLLGCCIDKGEKMLIYEYLENLSLDSHLFDKIRSSNLSWQKRFDITNGIARGLLYLHQDSRFRIIHRDLKASNVLLDKNMTPKISDFGMARIFGRDETEPNTRKVVGTYGYMAPEYAMDGIFSMAHQDGFGVLPLELTDDSSGYLQLGFELVFSSNNASNHPVKPLDVSPRCIQLASRSFLFLRVLLLSQLEFAQSSLQGSVVLIDHDVPLLRTHKILRCIQIGLLCVQERAEDRQVMSTVMVMLGSETTAIPQPKRPGFCVGRNLLETESSSSTQRDDELSVNQITLSVIDAR
ncbi:unnamed protein product [Brassica oleracea var. botrytis]